METCMNSNASYNCSEAAPVFNVSQPSWCLASTTDEPSTTITDGPSTTITDIITTLVSNATTSLFTNLSSSSKVPMTTVTERPVTVTTNTPEPTEPTTPVICPPECTESTGGGGGVYDECPPECTVEVQDLIPWWVWCIVAGVAITATTCIIIIILWYKKKKENQSDISQASSELHCDDPHMTLQNQTSTVELIGKDEPDGGGIKTNLKENESDSHKIDIDKGGESKDGCNVEFKKAPIVLTTDL